MATLEESLDEWRDDVGTQPPDRLPPTPEEWAAKCSRKATYQTIPKALLAAAIVAALFLAVSYAASWLPSPAEVASWLPDPAAAVAPAQPVQPHSPPAPPLSSTPLMSAPVGFEGWPALAGLAVAAALIWLLAAGLRRAAAQRRLSLRESSAAFAERKTAIEEREATLAERKTTRAWSMVGAALKQAAGSIAAPLGRMTESLAAARRREIARLLHLLDVDPDRGLRFALPLTGGGHRGLASPGARLPERKIGFLLSRLGGGGPADLWNTGYDQQFQLQRRYRELAQREMELGRHRRAAYVFAELLGDLPAAALALEQGDFFHEAAVIYRDKLDQSLAAARCFERGGNFDEAVKIYAKRGELETAADLLIRVARAEEAAALYRQAVAKARIAGDFERAARLLEEKLHAVDEAVQTLAATWPDAPQVQPCLRSLFRLLGRTGRHAEASQWVARLKTEPVAGRPLDALLATLPNLATGYPDRAVRAEAADATRVLAGNRLAQCEDGEAERWMRAVRSLAPEDELLGLDTQRYLDRGRLPAARPARGRWQVVPLNSFRLSGAEWWKTAAATEGGFFAAGYGPAGVVVARAGWKGEAQFLHWPMPLAEVGRVAIASPPDPRQATLLAVLGQSHPLQWQTLPAIAGGELPGRIGTPDWLDSNVLAIGCSDTGIYWSIDDRLVLNAVQGGSVALSTRQLSLVELGFRTPWAEGDDPGDSFPLIAARGDRVIIAWGRTLTIVQGQRLTPLELGGRARRLALTRSPLPLRVAIGFEDHGVEVVWLDSTAPSRMAPFDGLPEPELTWTRDSLVVAAYGGDLRVYSTGGDELVERCRFHCGLNLPVAVLAGDAAGEFGVLTASGEVKRFRIES